MPNFLGLFVAALLAAPLCRADDGACEVPEAPRAGTAMMQAKMTSNADPLFQDAPLKGRIVTALSEVASLQNRVAVIMQETGLSGTGGTGGAAAAVPAAPAPPPATPAPTQPAPEEAVLLKKDGTNGTEMVMDKAGLYARYKELLHTKKYDESSVKQDVATLETQCATLKSNVLMLENQVSGGSLAQVKAHADSPTSLSTRVESVESDVSDLRTRVTSLEQVVAGLQMKSTKAAAALMQTSSSSKTKLGPLSARLDALEKEVTSLQSRTGTLETSIQGQGAVAMLAEDSEDLVRSTSSGKTSHKYASLLQQEATRSGEGTIKERTAALESNVAALKSKMAMLENQAVGRTSSGTPLALLQAEAKASGSSLKARISGLEDEVDSLRTRVTTLEHVVEG